MTINIIMPKLSDTMTDGQFICWRKNVGETVERGDVLAEIETDKAVMELESFGSGILIKTIAQAGETVPVGTVLGLIGDPEELPEGIELASPDTTEEPPEPAKAEKAGAGTLSRSLHDSVEHEKASPIVRRMARELGIDLSLLQGSGPDGRITQEDLQNYVTELRSKPEPEGVTAETAASQRKEETETGISVQGAMRQAITATVSRSWREIPHFSVTVEIAMDSCREIVSELKEERHLIGYHSLIIKACASALEHFPRLNTTKGLRPGDISIGFAVALPEGLLIPVIKECQRLSVEEIGYEASRLTEKSRTGRLSADEMTGGGFTVSNLGMYGVDEFSALIVPGQTAILAVGAVTERPQVREGQLVVAPTMRVTLACDHRVIDGAYAASFLAKLRRNLEHPLLLLLKYPIA